MKKVIITTLVIILFCLLIISCDSKRGIKVIKLNVPSDPTISFKIWFKVGSQNDPAGKEGLAEMTADLITDGSTLQNGYEKILEKLYPMAADYEASVDKEMTIINGRVHKDKLDDYFELFSQAIISPAFKQEDFDRIKSNKINYLEKTLRYSNDEAFGKEVLYQMIFEGTSYGHPDAGLLESVKSISLADIKEFYQQYYTRDNVVIGIGGGFENSLVDRLKKELSTLPAGKPALTAKSVPAAIEGLQVTLVEKNTQSTAISFGFPIDVHRGEDDYYALWIANSWFGEHRNSSSHLYQVIREARGMNYGDYSYIECFPHGWARQFPPTNVGRRQQIFEVWIRPVQNQSAHFALRAAFLELQKLVDDGMTQDDFDLTKKFLKKYYLHFAPTTTVRLGYKIDDTFYDIDDHLKKFPKMLDKLTLADVNAAIKRHLQFQNIKIAMITPHAAAFKTALVEDRPSPMSYATPKPDEVMDEDKTIEKYSLKINSENVKIFNADDMFIK